MAKRKTSAQLNRETANFLRAQQFARTTAKAILQLRKAGDDAAARALEEASQKICDAITEQRL